MLKGLRRAGIAMASILVLCGTATAATPLKIVDTKADESHPSVADGWAAWSANTQAHRKALHGYVRPAGGAVSQIPVRGHVRIGNIVTDGPHTGQVVLQTDAGGDGNIRFYDLTTHHVSNAPARVNTAKWEDDPSVSGDYLAFIRYAGGSWSLKLYRFSTGAVTTILTGGVYQPQVSGDYVAFSRCLGAKVASCKVVYRYTISTGALKKVPLPNVGRADYYAAVSADGTLYWVEGSATKCGAKVRIRRLQTGSFSTLWTAPAGVEIAHLQGDVLGGMPTLAFTRFVCSSSRSGAYRLNV